MFDREGRPAVCWEGSLFRICGDQHCHKPGRPSLETTRALLGPASPSCVCTLPSILCLIGCETSWQGAVHHFQVTGHLLCCAEITGEGVCSSEDQDCSFMLLWSIKLTSSFSVMLAAQNISTPRPVLPSAAFRTDYLFSFFIWCLMTGKHKDVSLHKQHIKEKHGVRRVPEVRGSLEGCFSNSFHLCCPTPWLTLPSEEQTVWKAWNKVFLCLYSNLVNPHYVDRWGTSSKT